MLPAANKTFPLNKSLLRLRLGQELICYGVGSCPEVVLINLVILKGRSPGKHGEGGLEYFHVLGEANRMETGANGVAH